MAHDSAPARFWAWGAQGRGQAARGAVQASVPPPVDVTLTLPLDEAEDPAALARRLAQKLGRTVDDLPAGWGVRKRSIDARKGKVRFVYVVRLGPDDTAPLPGLQEAKGGPPVLIVGAGPAGLFCAYALARRGIPAVVLERGKKVQPRRRDLNLVNQKGQVDAESNYCFGEGGAGTYSDGKLYTRSDKRGDVQDVLRILVDCGATADILVDARPHIGSNKLPRVVTTLRERLEAVGVQFRFGTRVTGVAKQGDAVTGVELADGTVLDGRAVVIATGHSARDVHHMLLRAGALLEPKPFALGVRIEHPQPIIDAIQYGQSAGHEKLPAAAYRLAHTEDGRGTFSFCMCPGGFIVPANTAAGEVVVNGMSPSLRNSRYANSGIVAAISPDQVAAAGYTGPLAGVAYQARVEQLAFTEGGGGFRAPAARVTDFLRRRVSRDLPSTSYQPGLAAADLEPVLDGAGVPVADALRRGLAAFGEKMRGFVTGDAVVVATESRTSSPVRIVRDKESWQAPGLQGLYPCAEGAGYAGGIVSAAIDGMKVADRIARGG